MEELLQAVGDFFEASNNLPESSFEWKEDNEATKQNSVAYYKLWEVFQKLKGDQ